MDYNRICKAFEGFFGKGIEESVIRGVLGHPQDLTPQEIAFIKTLASMCDVGSVVVEENVVVAEATVKDEVVSEATTESEVEDETVSVCDSTNTEASSTVRGSSGNKLVFKTDAWMKLRGRSCGSSLKAFVSEIKELSDISQWRDWVESGRCFNEKRKRAAYIRQWSVEGRTEGLDEEADGVDAAKIVSKMNAELRSGAVEQVGLKTAKDKVDELKLFCELLENKKFASPAPYSLFGIFLPPRRPLDLVDFKVFDTVKEATDEKCDNYFAKDEGGVFHFGVFKNCKLVGTQTFSAESLMPICRSPELFEAAMDFLHSKPSGWKLTTANKNTISKCISSYIGVNNNTMRHYYESVVAKRLSLSNLKRLQYWLAHTADTAQTYYDDSDLLKTSLKN